MKRYMAAGMLVLLAAVVPLTGCDVADGMESDTPRQSLFIGVDISGSFMNGGHFNDSMEFLAYYIYGHLNGVGGMERPNALFVSSIGGATAGEPKTFYPIQTFENKSVEEIHTTLMEMFPKDNPNPFTDYNAFFEQVAYTVHSKNLVLRPITVVMVSDGVPDVARGGKTSYDSVVLTPLERLARSVTVRLLYTNAVVGKSWQTEVARKRVKVWTQDAEVMRSWKDPKIMLADVPFEEQPHFFEWVGDNVDFGVRSRRVN
ncbi:MAG: hypothetical protein OEX18_13290 [Candidatus Krumholzibacteria bacterium]|nr:hypothetical protein [Candidatus Krumholzibacteria bacterium]MDH4338240.1 hypothetical protein [Candidatus Krumholzibacteria bacterium]MDH5270551.1 hypothetical protein [Candidatus Krumholzibacteria bacterium]MDH5626811.1 hypothetical protein [Candidatus Krumholzibacteria bacterium]